MSEFFGIRAKLYHYVLENGSVGSRHKVIKVRVTYGHWRIGTFHYDWEVIHGKYTTQLLYIVIEMKDNNLVSTSTITWKDIEKAQNKIMVHYVARYKEDLRDYVDGDKYFCINRYKLHGFRYRVLLELDA
uniref:Uncharacterized protein n=1 Tax=Rhizophagus irregularis (strain DAOM 181602 / DAOM 197198 / MUCL 43194) TaxID=747089 RepID=U9V0B7_RHIID